LELESGELPAEILELCDDVVLMLGLAIENEIPAAPGTAELAAGRTEGSSGS
jgi:hypothetical protein